MEGFPTTFEKKKNPERNSWGYCVRKKELLLEFKKTIVIIVPEMKNKWLKKKKANCCCIT